MAKTPVKAVDPVEAAKMSRPVAPPPKVEPPAQIILPVVVQPAAAPAVPARVMRVKVAKKISIHGHVTRLAVGTIVSEGSYGEGIFERLAEAKVELEPMP